MSGDAVKQAILDVRRAKDNLAFTVAATFPIGSEVTWRKGRGDHWQYGTVMDHGGTGRCGQLYVESGKSQKRYWITMYDVLGYVEADTSENKVVKKKCR